MAKTKKKPEAAKPKDETLELVIGHFNDAWEYAKSSWHSRWEDNYKLYNNERIKRGYLGVSDTFVPMTFSTVETLVSGLFGSKPKFQYLPPQNRQDQDTTILNALVDYYWDKDQWSLKIINTGRGFVREGTAVDYWIWDIDHPVLINVPIRDFFINPFAYELDERTTGWCGRRYLTTLDELESYEIVDLEAMEKAEITIDPETGEPTEVETVFKKKYKNLDKLKGVDKDEPVKGSGKISSDQNTDKQEKDNLYGSTLPDGKDQVEVIEYWTVDRCISVANRQYVIEDCENYFKAKDRANGTEYPRGILPFADARNYVDASLFYAKGDVDFIADQQEDLNDFSNQEKDAVSYNLNPQKTLSPKHKDLMKEIENVPGEIVPVEAGEFMPVPTGVIPAEAFNERQNIKAEIRETTASNEIIKGASQDGNGKQTATEINAQIAGAGQRIGLKVTQLENGYFHRMAKIVYRMIQLYVTEPMMVQIIGKEGAAWEEFDPAEFDGQYEPRVQLEITMQQKKNNQQEQAANLLKAFLNDPNVDQRELTKKSLQWGFELDPDEVESLLVPQEVLDQQAQEAAMVQGQGAPGQPQPGMPPEGQPPTSSDPLAAIPPELIGQIPEDVTPEELGMIRQAAVGDPSIPT